MRRETMFSSNTESRAKTWRRRLFAVLLALGAGSGSVAAQEAVELPKPLAAQLAAAEAECASFENGSLSMEWGAVRRVDLDGDRQPDWVLDEAGFVCSSAVSLFCGTGGCASHFLVGDVLQSVLNQGWEVVTIGPNRVVLLDVHGSLCGGINPTPCVVAGVWDADERMWRSAIAEFE